MHTPVGHPSPPPPSSQSIRRGLRIRYAYDRGCPMHQWPMAYIHTSVVIKSDHHHQRNSE
jgi:hypothetical protein